MYKLCSLKQMVPGSVVEVPEEYRAEEHELGIVLGLEYAANRKDIRPLLMRKSKDGYFFRSAVGCVPDTTEYPVVDDKKIAGELVATFRNRVQSLPPMFMSSGCDPEIFVTHLDGKVFPAWEFMPSEEEARAQAKEWMGKRWEVEEKYWGNSSALSGAPAVESKEGYLGAILEGTSNVTCPWVVPAYWDGAQAEFAPWAKVCLETLHHGTREGLKAVLDSARKKDVGARLTLKNVIELPEATLKNAEDKHIQFHCTPSWNVYGDPGVGIPNGREYKYRCAGGHIHVGYSRILTAPGIEQIVRSLDGVLGVAGVSLAAGIDDPERRNTYGRAGEFRLPEHGLEYRVLSNFWLSHPAVAMLVFELARAVVRMGESGLYNLCWDAKEREIRDVINGCDIDGARAILRRNMGVLLALFHAVWPVESVARPQALQEKMVKLAVKAIMEGIGEVISDPFNIESNWLIDNPSGWTKHCHGKNCSWKSLAENSK